MVETPLLHISEMGFQHYRELLRLGIPNWQLKQAHGELGKEHFLLNLALKWLDRWIVSLGEQAQNNPDIVCPYYWSAPGSMMYASRFRRIM